MPILTHSHNTLTLSIYPKKTFVLLSLTLTLSHFSHASPSPLSLTLTPLSLPLTTDRVLHAHSHSLLHSLPFNKTHIFSLTPLPHLSDSSQPTLTHSHTLSLQIESYMPILLAVGGSNAIQTLRIDSNTVSVWDKAFQLAVTSLRHNSTLRTLSLAHWTFDLQVSESGRERECEGVYKLCEKVKKV
ncbi:hypothetical protein Pcinc_040813 [Petrolisthes cinctipes]|uniref:Uncharacterized protein n=1 Tax=Petrolisthes cinctipes TaxID=88211 RepID=A0AAE1BNH4_PETCI|nr:hypothetical protein Pcinc_040813 [Petrolisthes cinctipes]